MGLPGPEILKKQEGEAPSLPSPDQVLKKKEVASSPSTSSPSGGTPKFVRSYQLDTTMAPSPSASIPSSTAVVPNIVNNQNLYTGASNPYRGEYRPQQDIADKARSDYEQGITPTMGYNALADAWQKGNNPTDVVLNPQNYVPPTDTESQKEERQAARLVVMPEGAEAYAYDQQYRKAEEANKAVRFNTPGTTENEYAKQQALFEQGVGVEPSPLPEKSTLERARELQSYYLLSTGNPAYRENIDRENYYANQKKVVEDQYAAIVAGHGGIENTPQSQQDQYAEYFKEADLEMQRSRAMRDVSALNFMNSAVNRGAEIDNKTLTDTYGAQLAVYNQLTETLDAWPKDPSGKYIVNTPEEQQQLEGYFNNYNVLLQDAGFVSAVESLGAKKQESDNIQKAYQQVVRDNPLFFTEKAETKAKAEREERRLERSPYGWLDKNIGNPIVNAIVDFGVGITYVPKAFGEGDAYGWTDQLYDSADNFRATQVLPFTPVAKGILPQIVSAGTTMALMYFTGAGLGSALGGSTVALRAGQAVAGTVATMEGYYQSGIQAGMSRKDAESYSVVSGVIQGMLEMINPEAAMGKPAIVKSADTYMSILANGGTKSAARLEATKIIFRNMGAEITQEFAQQYAEWSVNMTANQTMGTSLDTGEEWAKTLGETAVITALLSGVVGGAQVGGVNVSTKEGLRFTGLENRLQTEALYSVGADPLRYRNRTADMVLRGEITNEKAAEINAQIDQAEAVFNKLPKDITPEKAVEVIPEIQKKMDLESQLKTTDKAFHPEIEQKIAQTEADIQRAAGVKSEERIAQEQDKEVMEREEMVALQHEKAVVGELDQKQSEKLSKLEAKYSPSEQGAVETSKETARPKVEPIAPDTKTDNQVDDEQTVAKLNEDVETIKGLPFTAVASKLKSVENRINQAVTEGKITEATAKDITSKVNEASSQRIADTKKNVTAKIDTATEAAITALKKIGFIGQKEWTAEDGTKHKIESNSILDTEALIRTTSELVKKAVIAGVDVTVAINNGLVAIKNHPAFKQAVKDGRITEDQFDQIVKPVFNQAAEDFQKEYKESNIHQSRISKSVLESEAIPEETKRAFRDEGIDHIIQSQAMQAEDADRFIDYHEEIGELDAVLDAVSDQFNGMNPDVRGMVAARLYNKYSDLQKRKDIDQGQKDKYAYRAGQALSLTNASLSKSGRALRNVSREIHKVLATQGVDGMMAQLSGIVGEQVDQTMKRKGVKKAVKDVAQKANDFFKNFSEKIPESKERKTKLERMQEMAAELDNISGTTEYSDHLKAYNKMLSDDAAAKEAAKFIDEMKKKFVGLDEKGKRKLVADVLSKLNEQGKLNDADVSAMYREALHGQEMTPKVKEMFRKNLQAMKDYVDLEASRLEKKKELNDKYEQDIKNATPEQEAALSKQYKKDIEKLNDDILAAKYKAEKAHDQIAEEFLGERGFIETLRMVMPSNLFSPGGIMQNLIFNVSMGPVRMAKGFIASGYSAAFTSGKNFFRKKKNLSPVVRSNRILSQMLGMARYGLKYGGVEAYHRSIQGVQSVEDLEKFDLRRSVKPFSAAISLLKKKKPNQRMYRYIEDKLAAALEASPAGMMSTVALRAMGFGDAGPREMAKYMKLMEMAITTKGLRTTEAIDEFVHHPDPDSLQYAETWAKELVYQRDADKINKGIVEQATDASKDVGKAGMDLVSEILDLLSKAVDAPAKRMETMGSSELSSEAGRHTAALWRLAVATQIPFYKTLARAVPEILYYTMPWIGFVRGSVKMMKAAEVLNKYDELPNDMQHEAARKKLMFTHDMLRNEAMGSFAAGTIAMGIASMSAYLLAKGIITGGDDKDELGVRTGHGPYKVNISALGRVGDEDWSKERNGDVWISYDQLGTAGLAIGANVDALRKDGYIPGVEQTYTVLDALQGAGFSAFPKILDQPLIKSTQTVLDSWRRGGNSIEKWKANTLGTLTAAVYPNTIQIISKSMDVYDRDIQPGDSDPTKPGTQVDYMALYQNRLKQGSFQGDKLPPKVDMFGVPVKSTTTSQDFLWRGNAEKADTESTMYKIWDTKRKLPVDSQAAKDIVPPEIGFTFSVPENKYHNAVSVQLTPQERYELQVLCGVKREQLCDMYVGSVDWDKDSPEERASKLNDLYREADKSGKLEFLSLNPELFDR